VSSYDLYRQITAGGMPCHVIAPALTPRRPGPRIKTDRRDAAELVRLFRAGELTAIQVPWQGMADETPPFIHHSMSTFWAFPTG
jgi:transposase